MQKKFTLTFPEELVERLDEDRGSVSRNRFMLQLLARHLELARERRLIRTTAEVYDESAFAAEEEFLSESFIRVAPNADL